MLNRKKKKKKCFLAVSLAVKTTFVSVLQENSSVKIKFRFSLSPKIITLTIQACESSPISIYEISPYKMAPCVFNGIIFLFGSSIKPGKSLLAAHFTLCIDSDVQKNRHRTDPIDLWASLTPGRELSLQRGKNILLHDKTFNLTKLFLQCGNIWFGC